MNKELFSSSIPIIGQDQTKYVKIWNRYVQSEVHLLLGADGEYDQKLMKKYNRRKSFFLYRWLTKETKALKNLDDQALKEAERLEEPLIKYLLHKESSILKIQVPGDRIDHHEQKKTEGTHAYKFKLDADRLNSLHRFLQVHLAPRYSHLRQTSVLKNARVDAFWMRGGIDPDKKMESTF